ncbi:MAG: rhomboid family intramembrane serine protease [Gammaproteobacteria bacterium]|nr:rhomboid family intramembrane serine protease [Gammaproteobacteria bacterium]
MIPLHDDNPTHHPPYVTMAFIGICVLVFLWQQFLGPATAAYSLGAIPSVLFDTRELPAHLAWTPPWVTGITSMFLHGGWMHLIGNMLYLWIFGNNVEDAMGHVKYVVFYFVCGTIALLAHALPNAESTIPMVGASGAISGVLGAYLLLYPRARVLVLIPLGFIMQTLRLQAVWVLAFWFGLQIFSVWMAEDNTGGGVAWGAHIGGFVAGLVLIPLFKHRHLRLLAPARSAVG